MCRDSRVVRKWAGLLFFQAGLQLLRQKEKREKKKKKKKKRRRRAPNRCHARQIHLSSRMCTVRAEKRRSPSEPPAKIFDSTNLLQRATFVFFASHHRQELLKVDHAVTIRIHL